ncbi:unnamed protein product, partial [Rotaria magnacalcarata]|uniref:Uncharacterized protein n=2 Tax=Rotaria magnacalcarata TaxID=392030 RepID=A0A816YD13_9BILA
MYSYPIIDFSLNFRCPVHVPGSGAFPTPHQFEATTSTKTNPKISTPKFQSQTTTSSSNNPNLSTSPKQKSNTPSIPRPYPLKQRLAKKQPVSTTPRPAAPHPTSSTNNSIEGV